MSTSANKVRTRLSILAIAALSLPLVGCETPPRMDDGRVYQRGDRTDHDYRTYRDRDRQGDIAVRVVFNDRDRDLIREYYTPRDRRLPPGLAKQGKVPPGHARKLFRGAPLPADAYWHDVPRDLEVRLSPLPDGYVRVLVGADMVIMNVRTRIVVDLLEALD